MKPAMTILVCVLVAGMALAQSPSTIQNTRATINAAQDHAAAPNAAVGVQSKPPAAAGATHAPAKTAGAAAVAATPGPFTAKTGAGKASAGKASAGKPVRVAATHAHVQAGPAAPKEKKLAAKANKTAVASGNGEKAVGEGSAADHKVSTSGKRDPFVSPVVSRMGSSCNTGKKCLEIGTISLRGIVRAEFGFIAVVCNGLNKAYFLRENDPVFNGYVMKITADSIVFQETVQDRLGKPFTREVVKKITTPAV